VKTQNAKSHYGHNVDVTSLPYYCTDCEEAIAPENGTV
jgi:hypothetical protein